MAIDLSGLVWPRPKFTVLKSVLQAISDALDDKLDASAYNDRFYVPMVFDGFNENIVYWDEDGAKVPNFVTLDDGNLMLIEVENE